MTTKFRWNFTVKLKTLPFYCYCFKQIQRKTIFYGFLRILKRHWMRLYAVYENSKWGLLLLYWLRSPFFFHGWFTMRKTEENEKTLSSLVEKYNSEFPTERWSTSNASHLVFSFIGTVGFWFFCCLFSSSPLVTYHFSREMYI